MSSETVELWHFTGKQNIQSIRSEGLRSRGEDWDPDPSLTQAGETAFGDWGNALVELELDIGEKEIPAEFRRPCVHAGHPLVFYQIPSSFLKEHAVGEPRFYEIEGDQRRLIST